MESLATIRAEAVARRITFTGEQETINGVRMYKAIHKRNWSNPQEQPRTVALGFDKVSGRYVFERL